MLSNLSASKDNYSLGIKMLDNIFQQNQLNRLDRYNALIIIFKILYYQPTLIGCFIQLLRRNVQIYRYNPDNLKKFMDSLEKRQKFYDRFNFESIKNYLEEEKHKLKREEREMRMESNRRLRERRPGFGPCPFHL